jgi:hypothetical protein
MLGTLIIFFFQFGYNEVEGVRLRAGGRTYFGTDDTWRLRGIRRMVLKTINLNTDFQESGWLIGKIELFCQLEIDVEQIGASLTTTNDVLGRSFASSSLFSSGSNGKLTNINLSSVAVEIEPVKKLTFQSGLSYRTLESASRHLVWIILTPGKQ